MAVKSKKQPTIRTYEQIKRVVRTEQWTDPIGRKHLRYAHISDPEFLETMEVIRKMYNRRLDRLAEAEEAGRLPEGTMTIVKVKFPDRVKYDKYKFTHMTQEERQETIRKYLRALNSSATRVGELRKLEKVTSIIGEGYDEFKKNYRYMGRTRKLEGIEYTINRNLAGFVNSVWFDDYLLNKYGVKKAGEYRRVFWQLWDALKDTPEYKSGMYQGYDSGQRLNFFAYLLGTGMSMRGILETFAKQFRVQGDTDRQALAIEEALLNMRTKTKEDIQAEIEFLRKMNNK